MKVKKKDKKNLNDKKSHFEQLQADHEQFLQAFEKPTHIYRYLRTRQACNPVFLQRTLRYMKGRCNRKRRTWDGVKVDFLAEKLDEQQKLNNNLYKCENLGLEFKCLCAKGNSLIERAEVEVFLKKMAHSKRKDITTSACEKKMGVFSIPCTSGDGSKYRIGGEKLQFNGKEFQYSNGCAIRAYSLQFSVKCRKREGGTLESGLYNGYLESDTEKKSDSEGQPSSKKRKTRGNTKDNLVAEVSDSVKYDGFLTIFDHKHKKLLKDGDYEVVLYHTNPISDGESKWELADPLEQNNFDAFSKNPTIKFQVNWERTEELLTANLKEEPMETDKINGAVKDVSQSPKKDLCRTQEKRIFYHFLYNNNTRQQTEAREDMHCPWCTLDCVALYSLLKHLRTCHARFNFLYSEHPKGARVDVTVNPHYDGSYVGNPQDLQSHIGFAFSRLGPVRRTPVTQLLVYRPKKAPFDLSEFLEPETECSGIRLNVTGHNRLYYHVVSLQPVRPCEIDADSEEDVNPEWLRHKTVNLIDEFTDVNEGEKELMKMWNLHIMKHNYIGDVQLPIACSRFVQDYGVEIIKKKLLKNLILHVTNLYDFGLVRPDVVSRTMMQIHRLRFKMENDGLMGKKFECLDLGTKFRIGDSSTCSSSDIASQSSSVPSPL